MKTVIAALTLVISANAAVALPSVSRDLITAARGAAIADRVDRLTTAGILTDEQATYAAQVIATRELNDRQDKIDAALAVSETTTASDIRFSRDTEWHRAIHLSLGWERGPLPVADTNDITVRTYGTYYRHTPHNISNVEIRSWKHPLLVQTTLTITDNMWKNANTNNLALQIETWIETQKADSYSDGYNDGYRDGYRDGVRDTKAALQ